MRTQALILASVAILCQRVTASPALPIKARNALPEPVQIDARSNGYYAHDAPYRVVKITKGSEVASTVLYRRDRAIYTGTGPHGYYNSTMSATGETEMPSTTAMPDVSVRYNMTGHNQMKTTTDAEKNDPWSSDITYRTEKTPTTMIDDDYYTKYTSPMHMKPNKTSSLYVPGPTYPYTSLDNHEKYPMTSEDMYTRTIKASTSAAPTSDGYKNSMDRSTSSTAMYKPPATSDYAITYPTSDDLDYSMPQLTSTTSESAPMPSMTSSSTTWKGPEPTSTKLSRNIFGDVKSWKNPARFSAFNAPDAAWKRVYVNNWNFTGQGMTRENVTMELEQLQNIMVAAKALFEAKAAEQGGKECKCYAGAESSSSTDLLTLDPLIFCDEHSKYGIRLNNIRNSTWAINCDVAATYAVFLSEALKNENMLTFTDAESVPDGWGKEPRGYYWDGEMGPCPEEGRHWTTVAQTFVNHETDQIIYITKEKECPKDGRPGGKAWPGTVSPEALKRAA